MNPRINNNVHKKNYSPSARKDRFNEIGENRRKRPSKMHGYSLVENSGIDMNILQDIYPLPIIK